MFIRDLRFGFRNLVQQPAFTAVAVLTLALGVGATGAIYSVISAVLLEGLPFKDPDTLTLVTSASREGGEALPIAYPDLLDWRQQCDAFEALEGYSKIFTFNLMAGDEPEQVAAELVSAGYFGLLGHQPTQGRTFTIEEDSQPPKPVVVLSHDLWRGRFGAAEVLGQTLRLNGASYEIIGVMPAGFRGLTDQAQIWLPINAATTALGGHYITYRHYRWFEAVGRLAPGVTIEEARTALDTVALRLEETYPIENKDMATRVSALSEAWVGDLRLILSLLLGAAVLVLLVASTNLANLLLVRIMARQRELAVRSSLGASRTRLASQLLTENALLTLAGGVAGLLLARWTTNALIAASGLELKSFIDPRIDAAVVAVVLGISLVCGLLFGFIPAWMSTATRPAEVLREGGTSPIGRHRFLRLSVVVQVALALVLVLGAALLARQLDQVRNTDMGFNADDVLTVRVDLQGDRYRPQEAKLVAARRFLEELSAVPGVESLALAGPSIPTDDWYGGHYTIEQRTDGLDEGMVVLAFHFVSPEYFPLLGISLKQGRLLSYEDTATVQPVVVVSEALARRYWPGENPLGKRLKIGQRENENFPWLTVVGTVGDVHQHGLGEPNPVPDVYYSILQFTPFSPPKFNFLVRGRQGAPVTELAGPLRDAVLRVDPELPTYDVGLLLGRLEGQIAPRRFTALLMGLFAVLALVLAALGLYGVMHYLMAERRHEIGIRMALGAGRGEVVRLVLRRGLALTAGGVVLGAVVALGLARVYGSFLEDVSAVDPGIWAVTLVLMFVVTAAACFFPARRATRVEPMNTLRAE